MMDLFHLNSGFGQGTQKLNFLSLTEMHPECDFAASYACDFEKFEALCL